jgi:iron(III) transport system substrate-binding protein
MRFPSARVLAFVLLSSAFAASIANAANLAEVNVYSYRQPYLIDPLFKEFTDETGIKVNVIFAEKGLIERTQAEGRNSPADVVLTDDVGNLTQAADAGIAQPIQSAVLEGAIPTAYGAGDRDGRARRQGWLRRRSKLMREQNEFP